VTLPTLNVYSTLTIYLLQVLYTSIPSSGAYKYSMLYTFDYSLAQLDRCQDYVLDRYDIARIIHIQFDDLLDHYIALIDCDPATATLLSLI